MRKIAALLALLTCFGSARAVRIEIKGLPAATVCKVYGFHIDEQAPSVDKALVNLADTASANGEAVVDIAADAARMYIVTSGATPGPHYVFAAPTDTVTLTFRPGADMPEIDGSPVTCQVVRAMNQRNELGNAFVRYARTEGVSEEARFAAYEKMMADIEGLIAANLDNAGSLYLLRMMNGSVVDKYVDKISPQVCQGILKPIYEKCVALAEVYRAVSKADVAPGKPAPDFTLPDLQGKPVTLSSLRGKFVVIDFWGSWCGWCIKGFPELKKTYGELNDRLEVVGVDCGDSPEAWRAAVEKYELLWINVREPEEGVDRPSVLYGVQGFPTKLIIGPDGTILDVTVGENPEFFTKLRSFMDK